MCKKFAVAMAFVGVIMLNVGMVKAFAGTCGCPKEGKCAQGCESGKSDPCKCKH